MSTVVISRSTVKGAGGEGYMTKRRRWIAAFPRYSLSCFLLLGVEGISWPLLVGVETTDLLTEM